MIELLLGHLALGDVLVGDDDVRRVGIAESPDVDAEPPWLPGNLTQVLAVGSGLLAGEHRPDVGRNVRRVLHAVPAGLQARLRVARAHGATAPDHRMAVLLVSPRRVDGDDLAGRVEDGDPGREGVERRLEELTRLSQPPALLQQQVFPGAMSLPLQSLRLLHELGQGPVLPLAGTDDVVQGRGQEAQDLGLLRLDGEALTGEDEVDRAVSSLAGTLVPALEDVPDPVEEVIPLVGLVDVGIGPGFEPTDDIQGLAEVGQEDHRDAGPSGAGLDLLAQFITIQLRHPDVAEDQVEARRGEELQGAPGAEGELDLEPAHRQDPAEAHGLDAAVLHDQNAS